LSIGECIGVAACCCREGNRESKGDGRTCSTPRNGDTTVAAAHTDTAAWYVSGDAHARGVPGYDRCRSRTTEGSPSGDNADEQGRNKSNGKRESSNARNAIMNLALSCTPPHPWLLTVVRSPENTPTPGKQSRGERVLLLSQVDGVRCRVILPECVCHRTG